MGTCDHPAIAVCIMKHGSLSIEIQDNLLKGVFVDQYGKVKDSFTLTKDLNGMVD
jgi:hypothetical protein